MLAPPVSTKATSRRGGRRAGFLSRIVVIARRGARGEEEDELGWQITDGPVSRSEIHRFRAGPQFRVSTIGVRDLTAVVDLHQIKHLDLPNGHADRCGDSRHESAASGLLRRIVRPGASLRCSPRSRPNP